MNGSRFSSSFVIEGLIEAIEGVGWDLDEMFVKL